MTYIVEYCTFVLSVGDGLQAIQLEDGTTAYISQSTAATVFNDGSALETSSLSLENLQTQVYYNILFAQIYVSQSISVFNLKLSVTGVDQLIRCVI